MCEYMITEYACGHCLVHFFKPCTRKSEGRPFQHFPLCEHKEIPRKCSWNCAKCHAAFPENMRFQRKQATASCKKKIASGLKKMLGDRTGKEGFQGPVYVPTSAPLARVTRTLTKPAPEDRMLQSLASTNVATRRAAISLPYPLEKDEQPKHPRPAKRSWSTSDDREWQQASQATGKAINSFDDHTRTGSGSTELPLSTVPSRLGEPSLRSDEKSVHSKRACRRLPDRPMKSEIRLSHLGGQDRWKIKTPIAPTNKPLQEPVVSPVKDSGAEDAEKKIQIKGKEPSRRKLLPVSASELWSGTKTPLDPSEIPALATGIKGESFVDHYRWRSRAENQDLELFLTVDSTKVEEKRNENHLRSTPTILQAGRRIDAPARKETNVRNMPSILRPGRRDNTYKTQSVGQVPVHYGASVQKSERRKARLTTEDEARWEYFLEWSGFNERNQADNTWEEYLKWGGGGPSFQRSKTQERKAVLAGNTTVRKSENRKAPFTTKDEKSWSQYLDWAGLSERNEPEHTWEEYLKWTEVGSSSSHSQAQDGGSEPPVPQLPELEAFSHTIETPAQECEKVAREEEMRMSFRVSNPGLHDTYTPLPTNSQLPRAAAPIKEMGTTSAEMDISVYPKQPRGQVPTVRLQDLRHNPTFWPEPESEWDRIVVKVVASIESFLS